MKTALTIAALVTALVLLGCAEKDHPEREVPFGQYSYGDVQEGGATK